jgi:hypothetical protein
MSDSRMSRRKFLVGAGTVVGAAGITGLGLNKFASDAQAAGDALPWFYPQNPGDQPNPEAVARKAYEIYHGGGRGCAEAVWGAFVDTLAAYPEASGTWATLPLNIFRFGGGGVGGWGTLCGTLNGAAGILGMVIANGTHRGTLTDAIFQFYAQTALPTNDAYLSSQGQLGNLGAWAPATMPLQNVPTSVADSPLCHSSLVQWTMATGIKNSSPGQKDRCSKACFDVSFKLTELINTYFAAITETATPAPDDVSLDPSVYACRMCHVTYTGARMNCTSCHDMTTTDGHFLK